MRLAALPVLLLVAAAAVSWAAKIDIVAPTRGEVVARQRTREVQALEPGVVAALHADEGERVREGDLLVEVDDTIIASEIRSLDVRLREARLTARRLHLVLDGAGESGAGDSFERESGPFPSSGYPRRFGWERHHRLAVLDREGLEASLAEVESSLEAGRLRLAAVAAERGLVERLIPVLREQVDGFGALSARSHASRHEYLRELSKRMELEARAERLAIDARQAKKELARLRAVRRRLRYEHGALRQQELVEVEARIEQLREELVQALRRRARHLIVAPVDGVVQDLGELAPGSLVQRGDRLMTVVPVDGGLEIRAFVRNRDVGFVRAGQEAIVKIDAFPFTRYGTTPGVVEGVSLDAMGRGAEAWANQPVEPGAGYLARIALVRPVIEIDGVVIPLRPGMQAAVDIRTGRRRLIEYVVAPLVAYGSNAFRER